MKPRMPPPRRGRPTWVDLLGTDWGRRARQLAVTRALAYSASSFAIAVLLILQLPISVPFAVIANWVGLVVGFLLAYTIPVLFYLERRLRLGLGNSLREAGLSFSSSPPVKSAKSFARWQQTEELDRRLIRHALHNDE